MVRCQYNALPCLSRIASLPAVPNTRMHCAALNMPARMRGSSPMPEPHGYGWPEDMPFSQEHHLR